jgi:outer membrane protein
MQTMRSRALLFLLAAGVLTAGDVPVFPTPAYFRTTFSAPASRVELRPPVRLPDYVVGDKLELSLRSYLELVMANNTDIAIQRLSVETYQNAITRAFSSFDPTMSASFSATRTKTPTSDTLTSGSSYLNQLSQPADFLYTQRFQTGTTFTTEFYGYKLSSNSTYSTYNPALSSSLRFGFTQPLLKNRGLYVNRLPILIARDRRKISDQNFRVQLISLLSAAENAYWDVVSARENLKVQQDALKLSGVALKRAQRELELGALSPLDIYQPQAQYASAEIQVSQARFTLVQAEDTLRKQIGADLDPAIRKLALSVTEPVLPPKEEGGIDREAAVQTALRMRPDLNVAMRTLRVDDMNIQSASNARRPDLSLSGSYRTYGQGGLYTGNYATTGQLTPGGFGDALDQMFGFGYPTYVFGLTLKLPLRDHEAAADLADALVAKRQDALQMRSIQQNIRQQVLNAVTNVESSRASVRLATVARDLAKKTLEAEQKKYDLGASLLFYVLDAQSKLTTAESQLLTQSITYRRNQLSLLSTTGELLSVRGVAVQ